MLLPVTLGDNGNVDAGDFQLIAGDPALDFVNTVDWRFRETGSHDLLTDYGDLLAFVEQSGLLRKPALAVLRKSAQGGREAALQAAIDLRELCASVFYALVENKRPDPATISSLERHFKTAHANQTMINRRSHFAWEFEAVESADLPAWLLALRAESLLTSSSALQKLRACGVPECRWLFIDSSKNHSRRWCDMKICGNRVKARRFKAQHASQAARV